METINQRDKAKKSLDKLLAAECFFCGDIMIRYGDLENKYVYSTKKINMSIPIYKLIISVSLISLS